MKPSLFFKYSILALVFTTTSLKAENGKLDELSHFQDWRAYDKMSENFQSNYVQTCDALLAIVSDQESSNLNRCAAIYYLGQMRAVKAVDVLANNITIRFDQSKMPLFKHLENISISEYPAVDALVGIGNKSLPALVRNLATSDDAKVRRFSLEALCRIDNDRDIVRLRLQKALKAEENKDQQSRLQAATKALDQISFTK
jgi:HEAT repeat protein